MARAACRWFLTVLGMLALSALAVPSGAVADSAAAAREPSGYRQTVNRAVREFDAGNYAEARALFNRAHDLLPSARTHLGLGLSEYELRNYGTSIEQLEKALASQVKPLSPELRKSAEDVLAKARDLIGRVQLDVTPNAGRVLVDGVPVALVEGQALILEVGDHTIEVQTAGYLPERRALKIVGGEQVKLTVALRPPEAAPGPAAAAESDLVAAEPPAPERDDRAQGKRWYKSPWLWVSVGLVVAGGAVTAGLLLRPDAQEIRTSEPTVGDTTPEGGVLSLRSW
jgi:tetratricopeptide (TPR) repeat protein